MKNNNVEKDNDNSCYILKHVKNKDTIEMYEYCNHFLNRIQQSNDQFKNMNIKEIWIRVRRTVGTTHLPRNNAKNDEQKKDLIIYNKKEKYAQRLERDEKNIDKFRKWDRVDYIIYDTMNEKFPRHEYGYIVWFLLNRYDPDVRMVDMDQYCFKVEYEQQINLFKEENVQLKDELKTYKDRIANRFRRIEILYEAKRRQNIKFLYHQLYNKIKMELKQEHIINKLNTQKEPIPATKIENCTLTNCRIVTSGGESNQIKRKYTDLLNNNDDEKNVEEEQLSLLIDQIMKKIIVALNDESLRENLAFCLERKTKYWEHGGFVCCTNTNTNTKNNNKGGIDDNNNQQTKRFIFLKKGNDKWIQFLKTIGYEKIMENETESDTNLLQNIKKRLICGSKRVRLDGIENKHKVNKRPCIVLSSYV